MSLRLVYDADRDPKPTIRYVEGPQVPVSSQTCPNHESNTVSESKVVNLKEFRNRSNIRLIFDDPDRPDAA